ncbi:hypothetical protein LINPERHAP2_LOCUS13813, partial [Linum perenne]
QELCSNPSHGLHDRIPSQREGKEKKRQKQKSLKVTFARLFWRESANPLLSPFLFHFCSVNNSFPLYFPPDVDAPLTPDVDVSFTAIADIFSASLF